MIHTLRTSTTGASTTTSTLTRLTRLHILSHHHPYTWEGIFLLHNIPVKKGESNHAAFEFSFWIAFVADARIKSVSMCVLDVFFPLVFSLCYPVPLAPLCLMEVWHNIPCISWLLITGWLDTHLPPNKLIYLPVAHHPAICSLASAADVQALCYHFSILVSLFFFIILNRSHLPACWFFPLSFFKPPGSSRLFQPTLFCSVNHHPVHLHSQLPFSSHRLWVCVWHTKNHDPF